MPQDSTCRQEVTVGLENGLHLVPCSKIAQASAQFTCHIRIVKGDISVDAKDVLDLMTLNASCGTQLILEAAGDDAEHAMAQLARLFESNFDLEEDPRTEKVD